MVWLLEEVQCCSRCCTRLLQKICSRPVYAEDACCTRLRKDGISHIRSSLMTAIRGFSRPAWSRSTRQLRKDSFQLRRPRMVAKTVTTGQCVDHTKRKERN